MVSNIFIFTPHLGRWPNSTTVILVICLRWLKPPTSNQLQVILFPFPILPWVSSHPFVQLLNFGTPSAEDFPRASTLSRLLPQSFHQICSFHLAVVLKGEKSTKRRWWNQACLLSPLPGEMMQFDKYFSNGLKPPNKGVFWGVIICVFLTSIWICSKHLFAEFSGAFFSLNNKIWGETVVGWFRRGRRSSPWSKGKKCVFFPRWLFKKRGIPVTFTNEHVYKFRTASGFFRNDSILAYHEFIRIIDRYPWSEQPVMKSPWRSQLKIQEEREDVFKNAQKSCSIYKRTWFQSHTLVLFVKSGNPDLLCQLSVIFFFIQSKQHSSCCHALSMQTLWVTLTHQKHSWDIFLGCYCTLPLTNI